MPELTEDELRAHLKDDEAIRERRGRSLIDDVKPVSFATILGVGTMVQIGDKAYEVSPIPIKRLGQWREIHNACPEMLMVHAMAAARNGGNFDVTATVKFLESLKSAAPVEAEASAVADMDASKLSLVLVQYQNGGLSDEELDAMSAAVVFILKRKTPDISAEMIDDDLDVETFLRVMCALYLRDPNLIQGF